jgi:hypothetical protein
MKMRNKIRSKRAVNTMIGAVFFVAIIVVGFNLLLYGLAQNAQFQYSIAAMEARSQDRLAERLDILAARMVNCQNNACTLNLTTFNPGGRTVHIVRIWITNYTQGTGWQHRAFLVNYTIDPAALQTNIGRTLGVFRPFFTYTINLISDRGGIYATEYSLSSNIYQTASGSGWLTMDWSYYNYTYSTSKNQPDQGPYQAWCLQLSQGAHYLFFTSVINHWDRDVYILPHSYLIFYQNNGAAQPFYIMASSATAQNSFFNLGGYTAPYVTVPANPFDQQLGGPSVQLKFLANAAGGTDQKNTVFGSSGGSYAVFLELFYQDAQGNTLAQTIPFEATEANGSGSCG